MTQSRTSEAYRFTVGSINDPRIEFERQRVKHINLTRRLNDMNTKIASDIFSGKTPERTIRFVVRVRPRLGKHNIYAHLYRVGGSLHRPTSQDIRPEHATRFDVYVNEVKKAFTGK